MQGMVKISALTLVAILLAMPAFAGTMSYDTQSAFLSALSSSTTVNFDSNTAGVVVAGDGSSTAVLDGITFSANVNQGAGFLEVVNADTTMFDTTSGKNSLGSDDPTGSFAATDNITMTLGSPVTAFGLYVVGGFPAGTFTLDIGSGSAENTDTTLMFSGPNGGGSANYIGITSDTAFQTITIGVTVPGTDPTASPYWNVDDVTYGTAKTNTPPPVPEPSTLLLLGTGLAAVVSRLKKA